MDMTSPHLDELDRVFGPAGQGHGRLFPVLAEVERLRHELDLHGKHFTRNFHHWSVEVVGELLDVQCGGGDYQF